MNAHATVPFLRHSLAAAAALWLAVAPAHGQACLPPSETPPAPPAPTVPAEPKSESTPPATDNSPPVPRPASLDTEALLTGLTPETQDGALWAEAMRRLGRNTERSQVQALLSRLTPFPKPPFVTLLRHPDLSVRLGALECLETAAGRDFSYNPWLGPDSQDTAQTDALAAWDAWAAGSDPASAGTPKWSPERGESLIRDLLSGQRDREERAQSQLEAYGLHAIAHLDAFGTRHPDLDAAGLQRIRSAKYRLALVDRVRDEAAVLARQLVFGHRDQQLAAITRLKAIGLSALPIVADFVRSPDSLIRENAIDVFLSIGKSPALDAIRAELAAEPDKNVIHAILRQLGNLPTDPSRATVQSWLGHPDEDIVVEALGTLGKIGLDSVSLAAQRSTSTHGLSIPSGLSTSRVTVNVPAILGPHFKDPRWRVRAATLECVARLGLEDVAAESRAALDDPDEFVRAAAIQAAVSLRDAKAYPLLEKLFLNDPHMTGPVIGAFVSGEKPLPPPLIEKLRERSAEAILPAFASLDSSGTHALEILGHLTSHPDPDVSASAWRLLAQNADGATHRALLARQLTEGPADRRQSILENLPSYTAWDLRSPRIDFYRKAAVPVDRPVAVQSTGSSLDPLYRGFLEPLARQLRERPAPPPRIGWDALNADAWTSPETKGPPALAPPLTALLTAGSDEERLLAAGCLLVAHPDEPKAPAWLRQKFPDLPVSTRVNIVERLGSPPHPSALPLLRLALGDPASEVRSAALAAAFGQEGAIGLIQAVLADAASPQSPMTGRDLAGESFFELLRNSNSRPVVLIWSRSILNSTASEDRKILALAAIVSEWQDADAEVVLPLLKSPNPWLRRQAIVTLGLGSREKLRPEAPTLATDTVPLVRTALAAAYGGFRSGSHWQLRFSDTEAADAGSLTSRRYLPLDDTDRAVLKSLAADASPDVRFEALFSLLAQDQPVDLRAFTALIPLLSPATAAAARLGSFLEDEYPRLPRPFAALLPHADLDHIEERRIGAIMDHFELDEGHFLTFSAMVKAAGVDSTPVAAQPPAPSPQPRIAEGPLRALFFFSPGCPECARVRDLLGRLKNEFARLEVEEHSVAAAEGLLLNQALCLSQQVPARHQNVTPAVFTHAGYAIKENATSQNVRALLQRTESAAPEPGWPHFDARQRQDARSAVESRFSSLTLGTVLGGGLLDGINPCAFATLIFFLSYLQVARRSRGEILAVGAAFIAAVFLTYFAIGLGLNRALGWLEGFSGARRVLNIGFAVLALVVAALSLRDAFKARRGDLAGMTLQLPGLLKGRIREVIRSGSRSRRFVLAAFGSGIVISVLELACTGQVYAPIVYAIRQGSGSAVGWLLLYNTAFILPLAAVFLLAWSGMRSDALIRFQQKHTAAVKFGFAALFFALFLVLILAR